MSEVHIIKKVTFKKEWRCFAAGDVLEFRPCVNLLVGDQGSGKSSLLQLMQMDKDKPDRKKVKFVYEKGSPFFAFDFEKQNPRTVSQFGDNVYMETTSRFMSHGEAVRWVLLSIPKTDGATLALLDEPDMAMSPRSAYEIADLFKILAENGYQVIAAVHNPIIMQEMGEVLSVEHKRWMTAAELLEIQRKAVKKMPKKPKRKRA